MTDRVHSLIVVLDRNIRSDELRPVMDAILHIRHVLSVEPVRANAASGMADLEAKALNALRKSP